MLSYIVYEYVVYTYIVWRNTLHHFLLLHFLLYYASCNMLLQGDSGLALKKEE